MLKLRDDLGSHVEGVLYLNDVLALEGFICEEVLPALGLDVELVHGIPAVHIPSGLHSNNVGVLCEYLASDGAAELTICSRSHRNKPILYIMSR
jgi:hypothetical protein